jgi:hypothetical protein
VLNLCAAPCVCVVGTADTAATGGAGETKKDEGAVAFTPPSLAELFKVSPFFATATSLVDAAKVRVGVEKQGRE